MKTKKSKSRHVLVGNEAYGLYIGVTSDTDEQIVATQSVVLEECRHVCYWYGRTGGITSLAAHGVCGPQKMKSRIGAPARRALLIGVVNVYDLSDEAVASFADIVPTLTGKGRGYGSGGSGSGFGGGSGSGSESLIRVLVP